MLIESELNLQEIGAFDKTANMDFITESSVCHRDGCVILQTEIMMTVMKSSDMASQTDTIEGFIFN